jgi:hypothetical protein
MTWDETTFRKRVWHGIETIDPPGMAYDFAGLLAMAKAMLASRRKGFPAQVADGQRSQVDADAEIALFEDLVADWEFIAARGEGEPGNPRSREAQRDALDTSIKTIADLARSRGGFPKSLESQAEAVIALRWHLEPGRDQVALARLTHQLDASNPHRKAAPAPSQEPAQ